MSSFFSPAASQVEHTQVEALGADQLLPYLAVQAVRNQLLIGDRHREVDELIDDRPLAFGPRSQRLARHVDAVDVGVAGQHAQGGGVASHLQIGILEQVLGAPTGAHVLVQPDHGLDLLLDLGAHFQDELVLVRLLRSRCASAGRE